MKFTIYTTQESRQVQQCADVFERSVPCVFVWMLTRVYLQCDMQKLTVEELKRLLYDTFCDHLSMKDIENIIMTEENHIENPEDCQLDIDSKDPSPVLCGLDTAAQWACLHGLDKILLRH